MNFYRPTHASAEDIFVTPPEGRPFVDLSMTRNTWELPIRLRKLNTGATRWGNLVLGLAIDGAMRRGVSAEQIAESFAVGSVVAHATMAFTAETLAEMRDYGEEVGLGYAGSVEMHGDVLTVRGGSIEGLLDGEVMFRREGDLFVPQTGRYGTADESRPMEVDLRAPLEHDITSAHGRRFTPVQLLPAERLGDQEENVTASLDMYDLTGDMPGLNP